MSWWRRFVRAADVAAAEQSARLAEVKARAAAEQTRRLTRWPPSGDLQPDEYSARVAAAFGRRRHS